MEKAVFIVGMHRAGTSLVARLLAEAGLAAGPPEEHLDPNQWNAAGYLEHREFVSINDALLGEQDCSWSDALNFRPAKVSDAIKRHAAQRMRYLREGLQGDYAVLLKDPRSSLTLPLLAVQTDDVIVAVLRHPLAVAASIDTRDRLGMATSLALWELYMGHLLHHLAAFDRIVWVSYQALLEDSNAALKQLTSQLRSNGIDVDAARVDSAGIDSAKIRSEQQAAETYRDFLLPWQDGLWQRAQAHEVADRPLTLSPHSTDLLVQYHKLVRQRSFGHPAHVARQEAQSIRDRIQALEAALEDHLSRADRE